MGVEVCMCDYMPQMTESVLGSGFAWRQNGEYTVTNLKDRALIEESLIYGISLTITY